MNVLPVIWWGWRRHQKAWKQVDEQKHVPYLYRYKNRVFGIVIECRRRELNPYPLAGTGFWIPRVCQFRHFGLKMSRWDSTPVFRKWEYHILPPVVKARPPAKRIFQVANKVRFWQVHPEFSVISIDFSFIYCRLNGIRFCVAGWVLVI